MDYKLGSSRISTSLPTYPRTKTDFSYLDKKTEQIDRLVEKIQKKIELLKEQRTSLINQCVTKGLDPNVEMKDSGVEWIGIPKHWKFLKYIQQNYIKVIWENNLYEHLYTNSRLINGPEIFNDDLDYEHQDG